MRRELASGAPLLVKVFTVCVERTGGVGVKRRVERMKLSLKVLVSV